MALAVFTSINITQAAMPDHKPLFHLSIQIFVTISHTKHICRFKISETEQHFYMTIRSMFINLKICQNFEKW